LVAPRRAFLGGAPVEPGEIPAVNGYRISFCYQILECATHACIVTRRLAQTRPNKLCLPDFRGRPSTLFRPDSLIGEDGPRTGDSELGGERGQHIGGSLVQRDGALRGAGSRFRSPGIRGRGCADAAQ
ncbi:MAG: hypothetical protein QOH91_1833, partial [Mycobacterium sp.]|nr:hypothetical protein [Mycobacterium sp.]